MAIYLKKFETQAAYEAAQSGLILPNVSFTVDNNTVHYNPSSPTPPTPSYESVDLGLPSGTLWAKYNVGATSETEYGNYYQYGKGADDYSVTSGQSYYEGEEDPLATSADTAAQEWGGSWHIPTSAQCQELVDNTAYSWEEDFNGSGINGGKFTAQNGNYIFLPAAGYYDMEGMNELGNYAAYWSSTPYIDQNAYEFIFYDGGIECGNNNDYSHGNSVRAVIG